MKKSGCYSRPAAGRRAGLAGDSRERTGRAIARYKTTTNFTWFKREIVQIKQNFSVTLALIRKQRIYPRPDYLTPWSSYIHKEGTNPQ